MDDRPDIAAVAALAGEPSRARMLTALMEGRALTATELALEGGVAPSTASSHLEKLARGGLVAVTTEGRHRYYRIGGPEIGAAIESLMTIAPRMGGRSVRTGPSDEGLRRARVCYDHLAGETAVRLLRELSRRKCVRLSASAIALTPEGEHWFRRLGVDLEALRGRRRPLGRSCLDWSERQFHLAGSLGAALLQRLLILRFARRETGSRALLFSPRGEAFLETLDPPRV